MTNLFTPEPSVNAPINIYGSNVTRPRDVPQLPPSFKLRAVPKQWQGIVRAWEFTVQRLDGGFIQRGSFEETYNKLGSNAGSIWPDVRRGRLTSHLLTEGTALTANDHAALFWCHYGPTRTLVMGGGSTNNASLITETSATDPTPTQPSFNPGSTISCLAAGPIGGATAAEHIIVGFTGAAPQAHSSPGTSAGTMHTDLNPLWGAILSPINTATPGTRTWLFYAKNGIWTLPITAAIGDAPTQVSFNWANGGSHIGIETLANSPFGSAAYWLRPLQNRTTSAYTGGPDAMEVVRTNNEGTDPQIISFNLLSHVWFGDFWNRNLMVSDGFTLVAYDGENEEDMEVLNGLPHNSDYQWRIVGIRAIRGQLICRVTHTNTSDKSDFGMVMLYAGKQNGRHVWLPASGASNWAGAGFAAGSAASNGIPGHNSRYGPSMPVSLQTGYLHSGPRTNSNTWSRMFIVPPGVDAFNFYRQNQSGAGASKGWTQNFFAVSPAMSLPGELSEYPSVLDEIDNTRGNFAGGPATWNCGIYFSPVENEDTEVSSTAHYKFEFDQSSSARNRRSIRNGAGSAFHLFKWKYTYTTGSATNKTIDALPFTFRGLTFLDGKVRAPSEIWGVRKERPS